MRPQPTRCLAPQTPLERRPMPEVHLKQVRSPIGSDKKQLATLRTLKLGRIGRESKLEDTPQFRGALAKVEHLVEVQGSK